MLTATPIDVDEVAASFPTIDAMEEELQRLDGCTSRYRLEPHHIIHRAHGGDHDPDLLVLLCWFHHHHVVVHQYGFGIDPESPPGRRRFLAPGVTRAPPEE